MSVIYSVIGRSLHILDELGIEEMFLEVDQAIYAKVLVVMFRIEADGKEVFSKIVPRMGGFHIILCVLRTIYSRFKDSGIIQWLLYSGIGGEGTITNALNGGNVKHAIFLHKLMYEAIMRSKIRYLCTVGKLVIDNDLQETIDSFRDEISKNNFAVLCERLHLLPKLKGDMAVWLELLELELVGVG